MPHAHAEGRLAKRPSAAMSEEKRLPLARQRVVAFSNSPAFKLHLQGSAIIFQKCASDSIIRAQKKGA